MADHECQGLQAGIFHHRRKEVILKYFDVFTTRALELTTCLDERIANGKATKQQHAQKRRKKEETLPDSVEYLTVQRLTAEVEGKCQKYGRVGPLSIVHLNTSR